MRPAAERPHACMQARPLHATTQRGTCCCVGSRCRVCSATARCLWRRCMLLTKNLRLPPSPARAAAALAAARPPFSLCELPSAACRRPCSTSGVPGACALRLVPGPASGSASLAISGSRRFPESACGEIMCESSLGVQGWAWFVHAGDYKARARFRSRLVN
jgi:hypothetical protein